MGDERNLVGADGDILVCAFRYALGRMTYMVDMVACFIEANADRLKPETRELIIREIDGRRDRWTLDMEMDVRRWMQVRERLSSLAPTARGAGSADAREGENG